MDRHNDCDCDLLITAQVAWHRPRGPRSAYRYGWSAAGPRHAPIPRSDLTVVGGHCPRRLLVGAPLEELVARQMASGSANCCSICATASLEWAIT